MVLRRRIATSVVQLLLPESKVFVTVANGRRYLITFRSMGRAFAAPEWVVAVLEIPLNASPPPPVGYSAHSPDPFDFRLQHRVLPRVMSILEHAFFDYFSANIPKQLLKCARPEEVELNISTKVLVNALFSNPALLEGGLEAAVTIRELDTIRHVSVHRVKLDVMRLLRLIDIARAGVLLIEVPAGKRFEMLGKIRAVVIRARKTGMMEIKLAELLEEEDDLEFLELALTAELRGMLGKMEELKEGIRYVNSREREIALSRMWSQNVEMIDLEDLDSEDDELLFRRIATHEAIDETLKKVVEIRGQINDCQERIGKNQRSQAKVKDRSVEAILRELAGLEGETI